MKFVKKKMHEVMVQAAIWLQPECGVSSINVSPQLLTILGHDVRVTQVVSHNLRPCAPEHIGLGGAEAPKNAPYRWSWPSPNLCEEWWQAFADKLDPGRERATSATDSPIFRLQGLTEWRGSCPHPARS